MLAAIFSGRAAHTGVEWTSWSPTDPRWYESLGTRSDAGLSITPEAALSIGVVFRAINVLAHAVATVPLVIFRSLPDGGEERAPAHPQYRLLHDQPNAWQTSFSFRHLMVSRMILWGNFYAEIVPGGGGPRELVPLNPDVTQVIDQLSDGRLIYETRDKERSGYGPARKLLQDEVFHVRGFSYDGKSGVPLTKYARNAVGLALAAEKHGSMFMKRGAQFSGHLSTDGTLTKEVREANEAAWNRANGGFTGSGTVPLLEGGLKFTQTSSTNRDSQWLESRDFQIAELGPRFLGVPGLLCGYPDKTATYASAAEMTLAFVKHGVMPLTDNIRAELNRSVVTGAPDVSRADFVLEGLLRGDIETRYNAHRVAIMTGWKTRNEVRKLEGDNPGPGDLDEFFEPLNLGKAGDDQAGSDGTPAAPPRRRQPVPPPEDDEEAGQAKAAREIVQTVALHLVRKEVAAVVGTSGKRGAAARFAADGPGWRTWLGDFYGEHAKAVSERLRVPYDVAAGYCAGQRAALEDSAKAVERFEAEAPPRLVALAIGGRS